MTDAQSICKCLTCLFLRHRTWLEFPLGRLPQFFGRANTNTGLLRISPRRAAWLSDGGFAYRGFRETEIPALTLRCWGPALRSFRLRFAALIASGAGLLDRAATTVQSVVSIDIVRSQGKSMYHL